MADSTASKATATKAAPTQFKAAQPPENRGAMTVTSFVNAVLTDGRMREVVAALPEHVPIERFKRNFTVAISQNPKLAELDPGLVFREVAKAASFGLLLDPLLGEGYIVTAWNGKAKRVEPQLRIGYRGMIKLARQSGEMKNIYAHEVRQNDTFVAHQGTDKRIEHPISNFTDRGDVVGYYAVVQLTNGEVDFELMSQADAFDIRDRSDAWKSFKDGAVKSTPWSTDPVEMSKKTALRRLLKRVPMSPDLADAIRHEDDADGVIDQPTPPPPPRAGKPTSAHDGLSRMTDALVGKADTRKVTDTVDETAGGAVDDGDDGDGGGVDAPAQSEGGAPTEDVAIPLMPDALITKFVKEKNWLPAWKWLNLQIAEATPAVGGKLMTHHADIVRAMAGTSDNNRAIAIEWLQRFGVGEEILKEGSGDGGK